MVVQNADVINRQIGDQASPLVRYAELQPDFRLSAESCIPDLLNRYSSVLGCRVLEATGAGRKFDRGNFRGSALLGSAASEAGFRGIDEQQRASQPPQLDRGL